VVTVICPSCGKNYREEFSTGSYCFGCGTKEEFFTARTGGKPSSRQELRVTMDYLRQEDYRRLKEGWGITAEQADRYRFRLATDQENHDWLYMPIFNEVGKEVHAQMRAWSPGCRKKYMTRSAPAPGIIWKSWQGLQPQDEVAVVEGILDGVRVAEVMPAVALMGHAINEPRLKTLHGFTQRIVIVLDSDALRESLTLAQMYGILNSRVVSLPHGDPTDFSTDELRRLIHVASTGV
jgi:hypothetical protein